MNETFVEIPLDDRRHPHTDEFSFVLKPSGARGIGVFATHGIAQGSPLRLFPDGATRVFSHDELQHDPRLKRFCQFYGVDIGPGCSVAPDFGRMSVGWFLNHSDSPNARRDEKWDYFASRDIAAGEEVTIDYRDL